MSLQLGQRLSHWGLVTIGWLSSLWGSVIEAHDPYELLCANEMPICRVRVKNLSHFLASRLFVLSQYLFPFGCDGTRSWVKLRDIEDWELVASD